MDLFAIFRMILRRWKVVVPVGLLAVGLSVSVQAKVPPEYEATGWLLLETPALDAEESGPTIDPVALADGLAIPGVDPADFIVALIGGGNYSVSAAGASSEEAEERVSAVVAGLNDLVIRQQEAKEVAEAERVDLRMVMPEIAIQEQLDGGYLAIATLSLYDPAVLNLNPYGPDSATARVLQVAATGGRAGARFTELAGPGLGFDVAQAPRDEAPLLQVTTTGSDADRVLEAFDAVRQLISEDLQARQDRANVLPSKRISVGVIDAPLAVVDQSPPVDRAAAAILALGGLLALGSAFGAESVAQRRAVERRGRPSSFTILSARMRRARRGREASAAPREEDERPTGSADSVTESGQSMDGNGSSPSTTAGDRTKTDQPDAGRWALPPPTSRPPDVPPAPGAGILRRTVQLSGTRGPMEAYLATPETGSGPGVIVIQDWWGVDSQVRNATDRLAEEGFVALAPDLFGGVTTHDLEQVDKLLRILSVDEEAADLVVALDFLEGHEAVIGPTVGAIGYGMGGGLALVLAAQQGDRIGAIVPFYAVGGYDEVDLTKVSASVLGHFAAGDAVATPDEARRIEAELEQAPASTVFIRIHDGASHDFADEGDYFGTHDPGLAKATWEQSVAFLRDCLVPQRVPER